MLILKLINDSMTIIKINKSRTLAVAVRTAIGPICFECCETVDN
jgi:hypothetical protein